MDETQELRRRLSLAETLFDSIEEGFCAAERIPGEPVDFRYLTANKAFERQTGRGDPVGRTMRELFPTAEDAALECYAHVASTGHPTSLETYLPGLDRWFEAAATAVGGPGQVAILFRDVTTRKQAEQALRDSEERQAFLLRLSDALRPLSDPVDVQEVASRMIGEHLGVDRVAYSEVEGDENVVRRDYTRGVPSMVGRYPLSVFGQKIAGAFSRSGMVWAENTLASPELSDAEPAAFEDARIVAYLGSTLHKDGEIAAAFGLHQATPRVWTAHEIQLVEDVGERIWLAVERARMEAALRASEERQAFLLKFSDALRAEETADAVAALAPRLLVDHLLLDRCYTAIWRLAEDRVDLLHQINRTDSPDIPRTLRPSDFPEGLPRAISGTMVVENAALEPNLSDQDRQSLRRIGLNAFVAASLHKGAEKPVFVIMAASDAERRWSSGQVALIEEAAERTWAAMERARAEAAVRESEERQTYFLELSDALRPLADASEIMIAAVGTLGKAIGANRAFYGSIEPDGDTAHMYAIFADGVAEAAGTYSLRAFAPELVPDWLAGRVTITRDVDADPRFTEIERARYASLEARGAVGVPLVKGGRLQALLGVNSAEPRHWTETEVALIAGTAERTWAAVERARAEASLRESEERQAFLLRLSDALRPLADPDAIKDAATRVLGERLQVLRAQYWEADDSAEYLGSSGGYADGVASVTAHIRMDDFGAYVKDSYRAGRIMAVSDVATDPRVGPDELKAYDALGFRAWAGVPLVKNGRFVAALGLHNATSREWTALEMELTRETAERTWAAVERARAETAVRESEARLTAAFESVPAGAAIIDMAGAVVLSNAEYRRFLPSGVIPSRDPDRLWRWRGWTAAGDKLVPQDFPGARAMRGETVVPGQEMVYTGEDDREVWTSVAAAPLHDDAGRVTGTVSIISDIDAAKRSADALRASEERFRQFGEASQDVLWIRDAERLQWQYLTPAFEQIYGLAREEALAGDNFRSWLDLIVPEDREQALENIRRVRDGEQVAFEYRVRRPSDGAIRWLRNTDFPIRDDQGRITLIGGVGHDLTDFRETELRLRALVSGIPQLVWRAVDGGRWTWASPQWTAFTGQAEPESHDWGWLSALHPDDRKAACEAWGHAVERGGIEVEYRLCGGDTRSYRWFQTRATPVRDESGTIIEWLGTSTDIEDLRALQGRQQVMVKELQHRTRNLITVVGAISGQTMKNAKSLADFDQRFGRRLEALSRVQGLLSHLSAGKRVAFVELLRSELSALGAPDDKVTLDGPADVPLRSATVQTFSLALHELATNAVKYGALAGSRGHLTVRWSVAHGEADRPRLQVDWRESGVDLTHVGDRARGGGYGRELIEYALPYQLDANTTYEMTADGVHCTIDVPISAVQAESEAQLEHSAD